MKIKWLIILSVIFAGVILISLLITQQNNNIALLSEETPKNTLATNYSPVQPLSITRAPTPLSLMKSGITIIKTPPKEPEYNIPPAQIENNIKTEASSSGKNNSSNAARNADVQAGITKIGKHPAPKEAQEMNSNGIVMY